MEQYGRRWWIVLAAGAGLLGILVITATTRSASPSISTQDPVASVDCCSGPFRMSGWDLPSLRRELDAFSDDDFTVTFLDRIDKDPFEVRVRTDQQAAFVEQILGPDPRWFDVVVGDPGTAIPDPPPVSAHLLTVEEMLEARDTLLRIVQNEDGGGHVVRGPLRCRSWFELYDVGCSLDPGFISGTPGMLVSFENDEYLEVARRLFGPNVFYVDWEMVDDYVIGSSGIVSITRAESAEPVTQWTAATIAGVLFLVAIGFLLALVPSDFIAKRWFPVSSWALIGAGLVVMWFVGTADLLGFGYQGFGRVQVTGLGVAALVIAPAVYGLVRASFPGWKRAAAYGLILALAVAFASHMVALRNRPAYTVVGSVTIADRVSALPDPGPEEMADALWADVDLIRSPSLPQSARLTRTSYPVEMELSFSGDDPVEVRSAAEAVLGHYGAMKREDPLREPRGSVSLSVADAYPTDYFPLSVVGPYAIGALLLLLLIPWQWWRSGDSTTPVRGEALPSGSPPP